MALTTEAKSTAGALLADRRAPQTRQTSAPPPIAWYGGSWAYTDPDPTPTPPAKPPAPRDRAAERAKRRATFKPSEFGPEQRPGEGRGVILGRFQPPHVGHRYLIDFARHFVRELTILVRIAPGDPIQNEENVGWLREMFPGVKVVGVRDDQPFPDGKDRKRRDHWAGLVKLHAGSVDYLFASESYGDDFAAAIDARFVPVEPERRVVPVSGSDIRHDPLNAWSYLLPPARLHYLRRVCIIGPESSGKTTLARALARHYGTIATDEYARVLYGNRGEEWAPGDTQLIACGQAAAEKAAALQANRVMFCDTSPATVRLWSERMFDAAPAWMKSAPMPGGPYHLFLVTEPDLPFAGDPALDEPVLRRAFFNRCLKLANEAAAAAGKAGDHPAPAVVRIAGNEKERFDAAQAAVVPLIKEKPRKTKAKA